MQKGQDEDEMLDYRLRAIEIVNIADIAAEKEQFVTLSESLKLKKADLDKQEEVLLKEKAKREPKNKTKSPQMTGNTKRPSVSDITGGISMTD